jgi:hypothetical protein
MMKRMTYAWTGEDEATLERMAERGIYPEHATARPLRNTAPYISLPSGLNEAHVTKQSPVKGDARGRERAE